MLNRTTPLKRGTSQLARTPMNRGRGFMAKSHAAMTVTDDSGWTRPVKSPLKGIQRQPEPSKPKSLPTPSNPLDFRLPVRLSDIPAPVLKTPKLKSKALRDMARGRDCLLQIPEQGYHDSESTVMCHGNWSDMEKGGARKAQDFFSVWGCVSCHSSLDAEGASYEHKHIAFLSALQRQLQQWEGIATNSKEPERFRRAAQWALDEFAKSGYNVEEKLIWAQSQLRK